MSVNKREATEELIKSIGEHKYFPCCDKCWLSYTSDGKILCREKSDQVIEPHWICEEYQHWEDVK